MIPPAASVIDGVAAVEATGAIGVAFGGVTDGADEAGVADGATDGGVVDDTCSGGTLIAGIGGGGIGAGAVGTVGAGAATVGDVGAVVAAGAPGVVEVAATVLVLTSKRSFCASALVGSKFKISFSP